MPSFSTIVSNSHTPSYSTIVYNWPKNFEIDLVALVGGVAAAKTVAHYPTGRIGITQDVANAVAFLASPAVAHVNSANLTVDGGFLKRANYSAGS